MYCKFFYVWLNFGMKILILISWNLVVSVSLMEVFNNVFRVHLSSDAQFAQLQSSTTRSSLMLFGTAESKGLVMHFLNILVHQSVCFTYNPVFCKDFTLRLLFCWDQRDAFNMPFLQAILHKASITAYDVVGCGLWCVVFRAPDIEARGDPDRVCREVNSPFRK